MPRLLEICANGQTPEQARPDEVIKITKCITEVVNANIIPDLAYPELARTMRDRALENSIAYSEGKINNSTYVQRGQENWQRYIEEVEARAQPEPEYEETDPFIKDKIEQYHMASDGIMATVSFEDACRLAHTISAAYLNKKNSKQYAIWKSRESMDCGLASRGMQNSTDLLGAGRHMECSFRGSQHVCYMVDN